MFLAGDVTKLPKYAQEEANLLTVLDRMLKDENELKNMKSDVEASRLELLQQKDVASSHDNRLKVIEGHTSYASKVQVSAAPAAGSRTQKDAPGQVTTLHGNHDRLPPGGSAVPTATPQHRQANRTASMSGNHQMVPDTPQQGSSNDAPWRQQGRPCDWTNSRRL